MLVPQGQFFATEGSVAALDELTGEVMHPPASWSLLPLVTPTDPFDEEVVQCAANANGNTHRLQVARRGSIVTRWMFNGSDFMRRVDLGQSFGDNERIEENRGGGSDVREHNPTMGGAILKPDASPQWKMYPSVPLHHRWVVSGSQAVVETACIPFEFDSYGTEVATHANKNGGQDTPALMWRMRQFARTRINVLPDVHHHFFASYFPRTVNAAKCPMRALLVSSIWPIDYFGTGDADAIYYAPEDGTSFSLRTGDVNDWITATAPDTRVNWNLTASGLSGDVNPGLTYATGTLWNKARNSAIILKSDSARFDMVVGFVCQRLRAETAEQRFATELGASQIRTNSVTPGVDGNSGQRLSVRAATQQGRRRGWVGIQWWAVTGTTVAEVKARIDAASRGGIFDAEVPMLSIPQHVVAGTVPPTA
jgi:hypothetical protein